MQKKEKRSSGKSETGHSRENWERMMEIEKELLGRGENQDRMEPQRPVKKHLSRKSLTVLINAAGRSSNRSAQN